MTRLGVLASGTGTNLQAILDAARDGALRGLAEVRVVLSDRADAPALARARAAGVAAETVLRHDHASRDDFDAALAARLYAHEVDLVCLAGFLRLLGPRMLAAFPDRVLNVHPALLPAFPGLDAQRRALEHGVKFAGCTVHLVDDGVDTGPIVAQAVVPVYDDDDAESLARRILAEEHRLYPRAIALAAHGRLDHRGRRVLARGAPRRDLPSLRNPDL